MVNAHLDFRGMQVFCVVLQKKMLQWSPVGVIFVNKGQSWLNFSKLSFIFSNSQNKISILLLFYFCKIHVGFVVNQLIKKSDLATL